MLSRLFGKEEAPPQLPSAEQLEKQRKEEEEKLRKKDLEDRLESLDRFPGSLNEYIALKREEGLDYSETVVLMSTGRPDKFVYDMSGSDIENAEFENEENYLLDQLVKDGCIALIRYVRSDFDIGHICYGIPVKLKPAEYRK